MIIKIVDAPGVMGGKAIVLCDDAGKILPNQSCAVVENGVGEFASITVTFQIDGKFVRFA